MSECTCGGGTTFTDSMCVFCLKKVEQKLIARIEQLEEKIAPIVELIDDLETELDIVQWHIENPICPGGCGENTAHCRCEKVEETA